MRNTPGLGSYANICGTACRGILEEGELDDTVTFVEQFQPETEEARCMPPSRRPLSGKGVIRGWPDVIDGRQFLSHDLYRGETINLFINEKHS